MMKKIVQSLVYLNRQRAYAFGDGEEGLVARGYLQREESCWKDTVNSKLVKESSKVVWTVLLVVQKWWTIWVGNFSPEFGSIQTPTHPLQPQPHPHAPTQILSSNILQWLIHHGVLIDVIHTPISCHPFANQQESSTCNLYLKL